ncbi:hypothetical protein [Tardiphaga sp.]
MGAEFGDSTARDRAAAPNIVGEPMDRLFSDENREILANRGAASER